MRDDGVSYGDYVEQLTYLLFLKIADEHTKLPINKSSIIPEEYNWENLISKDGTDLEIQYKNTLENLSKKDGLLGTIFRKSQNKIQDPAKLKRIIDLIDKETWSGLNVDIKGSIYEGLLEKNAEDTKSGAGQYFTPRSVIKAIVNIMKPKPKQTICDPACGTGGFFLVSHDYISNNYQLDKEEKKFLKYNTFKGWDIVDNTARLCAMNLYLHGIGGEDEIPIIVGDSLISDPNEHFNLVLTNPPFGKKSSISISNSAGKTTKDSLSYERDDFWATTKNKQLNFLQHVKTLLKINGKAGIVVPDNVLFEAGAGETIRKKLLSDFDVHTLLRLPKGIFYARGVKANVLFFDKKPASEKAWTEKLWVYDLRTNKHFTLKKNPLKYEDFEDFIKRFNPNNRYERIESERFKSFSYNELMERDNVNLDIFWLKDESIENIDNLPSPDLIAMDIIENLESALSHFNIIYSDLEE
ncbi:MAG: type I restriction-modification system subunit M [Mycoplasmataceae bacterium]|nr:type I restriction-modification system subunit M [Mycoplasmataceae bacterium]